MNNLTLDEIRQERFYTIVDNMDAEDLVRYALEFIFNDDELGRKFVAEFLSDFDNEDDMYEDFDND